MKRKPTLEIPVPYATIAKALGIDRQTVSAWFQPDRRVPAERVLDVERITGVSRHYLRPDLYPESPPEIAARQPQPNGEAA